MVAPAPDHQPPHPPLRPVESEYHEAVGALLSVLRLIREQGATTCAGVLVGCVDGLPSSGDVQLLNATHLAREPGYFSPSAVHPTGGHGDNQPIHQPGTD